MVVGRHFVFVVRTSFLEVSHFLSQPVWVVGVQVLFIVESTPSKNELLNLPRTRYTKTFQGVYSLVSGFRTGRSLKFGLPRT